MDSEKPSKPRRAFSKLKLDTAYASVCRIRCREDAILLLPVGYAGIMLMYYVILGKILESIPGAIFLAAIPVLAYLGSKGVARYWVPFIVLMLSYGSLVGIAGANPSTEKVYSLVAADGYIWGFNLTGWVQTTLLSAPLTEVMTFVYYLQMPLVVFAAALIWYKRRSAFGQYVTAVLLTSYAALATFVIFPTAPPWFAGSAKDLLLGAGQAGSSGLAGALNNVIVTDKFAAFPSLHAALAVTFSYFVFKVDRSIGVLAVPVSAAVLFSTIYLGQHYMIDVLGGLVYALVPALLSERYRLFSVK